MGDGDGEALPRTAVGERQAPEAAAIAQLIAHEVEAPPIIWADRGGP